VEKCSQIPFRTARYPRDEGYYFQCNGNTFSLLLSNGPVPSIRRRWMNVLGSRSPRDLRGRLLLGFACIQQRARNRNVQARVSSSGKDCRDFGVRDGGQSLTELAASFLARLQQYYSDYEHQRGKLMCRNAGLLKLGCQELKLGFYMIPVWTPTVREIITEHDEEEIFFCNGMHVGLRFAQRAESRHVCTYVSM
jgi:hypothetical protein